MCRESLVRVHFCVVLIRVLFDHIASNMEISFRFFPVILDKFYFRPTACAGRQTRKSPRLKGTRINEVTLNTTENKAKESTKKLGGNYE